MLFLGGTMFGIYVIQTLGIAIFAYWWTVPIELVVKLLGIDSSEAIEVNMAKAIAASMTMIWNYSFYKYVVFKHKDEVHDSNTGI